MIERIIGILLALLVGGCAHEPNPGAAGKAAMEDCAKLPGMHPADVTACYVFASAMEMSKRPAHDFPRVIVQDHGVLIPSE